MPGLFVALAVLSVLAFGGMQAKKLAERVTLAPGRRYRITVSLIEAPVQARYDEELRKKLPGVQEILWISPTKVEVTIIPTEATTLDVGVPGPGGSHMVANVIELPISSDRPAISGGSPPRLTSAGKHAWYVTLETDQAILDKQSFEDALTARMKGLVVKMTWRNSRRLDVIVVTAGDVSRAVGKARTVRNMKVVVLAAKRLPT